MNAAPSLKVPRMTIVPPTSTTASKLSRTIVEHKYPIIYVAGAILISFAILKMWDKPWYMKRFQLSDFTEA